MPLGNNITNVLKGSTQVDRIMKGSTVVWENFKPIISPVKRSFAKSSSSKTTHTFSNMTIGAASASRWVAVCASGYDTSKRSITQITIGGVSATLRSALNVNSAAAVAFALVPTGTTATITVTFNSSATNCGIQVLTFEGGGAMRIVDYVTGTAASGSRLTNSNVACEEGGIVISAGSWVANSVGGHTWNGLDSVVSMTTGVTTASSGTVIKHSSCYVSTTENSTSRDLFFDLNSLSFSSVFGALLLSVSLVSD